MSLVIAAAVIFLGVMFDYQLTGVRRSLDRIRDQLERRL